VTVFLSSLVDAIKLTEILFIYWAAAGANVKKQKSRALAL
jgi:hypothetical protein